MPSTSSLGRRRLSSALLTIASTGADRFPVARQFANTAYSVSGARSAPTTSAVLRARAESPTANAFARATRPPSCRRRRSSASPSRRRRSARSIPRRAAPRRSSRSMRRCRSRSQRAPRPAADRFAEKSNDPINFAQRGSAKTTEASPTQPALARKRERAHVFVGNVSVDGQQRHELLVGQRRDRSLCARVGRSAEASSSSAAALTRSIKSLSTCCWRSYPAEIGRGVMAKPDVAGDLISGQMPSPGRRWMCSAPALSS